MATNTYVKHRNKRNIWRQVLAEQHHFQKCCQSSSETPGKRSDTQLQGKSDTEKRHLIKQGRVNVLNQLPDAMSEKGTMNRADEVKIFPFDNLKKPATPSLAEWNSTLSSFWWTHNALPNWYLNKCLLFFMLGYTPVLKTADLRLQIAECANPCAWH